MARDFLSLDGFEHPRKLLDDLITMEGSTTMTTTLTRG
jgi:hypothetical protein